jgi:hypothetical protein
MPVGSSRRYCPAYNERSDQSHRESARCETQWIAGKIGRLSGRRGCTVNLCCLAQSGLEVLKQDPLARLAGQIYTRGSDSSHCSLPSTIPWTPLFSKRSLKTGSASGRSDSILAIPSSTLWSIPNGRKKISILTRSSTSERHGQLSANSTSRGQCAWLVPSAHVRLSDIPERGDPVR